jgi:hypothetical protein
LLDNSQLDGRDDEIDSLSEKNSFLTQQVTKGRNRFFSPAIKDNGSE